MQHLAQALDAKVIIVSNADINQPASGQLKKLKANYVNLVVLSSTRTGWRIVYAHQRLTRRFCTDSGDY